MIRLIGPIRPIGRISSEPHLSHPPRLGVVFSPLLETPLSEKIFEVEQ
jgi:hypothetical protein